MIKIKQLLFCIRMWRQKMAYDPAVSDEFLPSRASINVARRLRPVLKTAEASTKPVKPNQVLAIVCVGMVLANLDLFIVNVALPNIAQDFAGAGLEKLS